MIVQFRDEFAWLSNFTPAKIKLYGFNYPSVEHAFMSAKSDDLEWKKFCINAGNSPAAIRRLGRLVKLKDNWEEIKIDVMRECLFQKFLQEPYKTKLLNTGAQYIQEGNYWNDKFWGVCLKTNEGENNLGKLIMEIRNMLSLDEVFNNQLK